MNKFKRSVTNKISQLSKKIIPPFLSIILVFTSIPNNIAYGETPDESLNTDINISIKWNDTNETVKNINTSSSGTIGIAQTVKYSSESTTKNYKVGDLAIVVNGLKSLYRNNDLLATVGADHIYNINKTRDWSYSYNSTDDTYTFINNYEIKSGTMLDGFFELVYADNPRESKNGASINDIGATLYYPDGSYNKTNKNLSITNNTVADKYTLAITRDGGIFSSDGLEDYVTNANDYIVLKYYLSSSLSYNSRGLQAGTYNVGLPSGAVICSNNVSANGNEVHLSEDINNQYIYVAVPKTYLGQTITSTLTLNGNFYEDGNKDIATANCSTILPVDFEYYTPLGNIYSFEKTNPNEINSFGGHINSNSIIGENGQEFSFSLNGSMNIKALNDGDKGSLEMIDDHIFISKTDGNYRQLNSNEYELAKVYIPDIYNFNNIKIKKGKYEVYACSNTNFSKQTLVKSGTINSFNGDIKLPAGTHSIGIIFSDLSESINNVQIPVTTKFYNINDDFLHVGGKIANTAYAKAYSVSGANKTDITVASDYPILQGINLKDIDVNAYGNQNLTRSVANAILYESSNDFQAITNLHYFLVNGKDVTTNAIIGTNFNFTDEAKPDKFSMYTILPDGLTLNGYSIPEDFYNSVFLSSTNGLSSEYLSTHCTYEVIDNYKGSGRQYIALHFNIPNITQNDSIYATLKIKARTDVVNNGIYYANLRSATIIDNGDSILSDRKNKDDGYWDAYDKTLASDIDNDGDYDELLSFDFSTQSFKYASSGQLNIKKYVKGSFDTDYKNDTKSEIGNDYTYKLEFTNGSSELSNLVVTDAIENLGELKGTFKSISFSKGYTGSKNGNTIKINEKIPAKTTVNIYITMTLPNDSSLIGKVAKNQFSAKGVLIDTESGVSTNVDLESNITTLTASPDLGNIIITKTDSTSGSKLENAKFDLLDSSNNVIASTQSNSAGLAIFKNLEKNKNYIIKETSAPNGYKIKTTNTNVTLTQENQNVTISNDRILGSMELTKVNNLDENYFVSGAKYQLVKDGINYGEYTTNSSGQILISNLNWGDYTIKEIQAPTGFNLNDKEYNFTINKENYDETIKINTSDSQDDVLVTLTKYISDIKGNPTTNVLAGARFNLYKKDSNKIIDTFVTNNDGKIIFDNIVYGKYTLKEAVTPQGYVKCEDMDFEISPTTKNITLTAYDQQKSGSIGIQKLDENEHIVKGAGFTLYDKDMETLKSNLMVDDNGQLSITNLNWGTYYLKETVTPTGYVVDNTLHKVVIKNTNLIEKINWTNKQKVGSITVKKIVGDSETEIVLSGAEFDLFKNDGTKITCVTTDNNGLAKVENLKWGSYYFVETKAPDGYNLDGEKHRFTINAENVDLAQVLTIKNYINTDNYLTIIKNIVANDNYAPHGDLSFLFKISYVDNLGKNIVRNAYINFKEGESTNKVIINKIPSTVTKVKVEEYIHDRYKVDGSSVQNITMNADGSKNNVTFKNVKTDWSEYSDSSLVVNSISKSAQITKINAVFNHDGYVNANEAIDKNELVVTAYYDDGTTKILGNDDYALNPENWPNQAGDYTVKVTYNGLETNFVGSINPSTIIPDPLLSNSKIQDFISSSAKNIIFTSNPAPTAVVLTNLGDTSDGKTKESDIVGWNDGTNYYVSTQNSTKTIRFPKNSNYMFEDKSNLVSLVDDIGVDTSAVTDMSDMFRGCSSLSDIRPLTEWDTSAATYMNNMFRGCSSLSDISALEKWNTSAVTNMSWMFGDCSSLSDISALEKWNTSAVTNMSYIFQSCSSLSVLTGLNSWDTSAVTDMSCMFTGCTNLSDINALEKWNTSSVTNMNTTFAGCSSLKDVNLNWNLSSLINTYDLFSSCTSLEKINFSLANSKISGISNLFNDCTNLKEIILNLNNSTIQSLDNAFKYLQNLEKITLFGNTNKLTSINSMLTTCPKLIDISGLSGLNISNVTSMSIVFAGCASLTDISALASWDTSKVEIMSGLFASCKKLKNITPLSSWNVSSVTNMSGLLNTCDVTDATCLNGWTIKSGCSMNGAFDNTCIKPTWYPY